MTDFLKELEIRKDRFNSKAEKFRRSRDTLNYETKKWAEKRDRLNSEVKKRVEKANRNRQARDELNQKVREAKALREDLNKQYNRLSEELNRLKRERLPNEGEKLSRLRADIKRLEFKQMTSVMTPDKERDLVDALNKLQAKIREHEMAFEENEEIQGGITAVKEAKEEAETQHSLVSQYAEKAQKEHDLMVGLYEESDGIRKEADEAQAHFLEAKKTADQEHRWHISFIRQVHDFDRILSGLRHKAKAEMSAKSQSAAKKEASDIYTKFKNGEKLSTEDLMALQKAGYL
jgi:uncharacterized coiled-coil DUF342 family protein